MKMYIILTNLKILVKCIVIWLDPQKSRQFEWSHNYRQMRLLAKDSLPGKVCQAHKVFQVNVQRIDSFLAIICHRTTAKKR